MALIVGHGIANTASPHSKKTPLALYREAVAAGRLKADPAQESLALRFEEIAERIDGEGGFLPRLRRLLGETASKPHGLYIWGGVGRGKSMLMDLFFAGLREDRKERVHFHAFMLALHRRIHALRAEPSERDPLETATREIAARTRVLCFDEFQVSDIADAMILSRLFSLLFEAGCFVVFTSNRAPDDLYAGGLQRERFLPFIELLKHRADIFELAAAEDYRTRRLRALDTVYFTPLGPAADAFMESSFRHLSGGDIPAASEIDVGGRRFQARVAGDVMWTSFETMCRGATAASDYLSLVETCKTLLLSGIPQMNREMRDAAKRFVTLIDILYESRTRLVCTAEAAPEALYPAGDGSFEFARTVSRLQEMQSADYLAGKQANGAVESGA